MIIPKSDQLVLTTQPGFCRHCSSHVTQVLINLGGTRKWVVADDGIKEWWEHCCNYLYERKKLEVA